MDIPPIPKYRDRTRTPVTDGSQNALAVLLSLSARQRVEEAELAQRHHEERATLARQWGQFVEQQIRPLEQKKSESPARPVQRQ